MLRVRTPTSVIVTIVLALLVAAGSVAAAAWLRPGERSGAQPARSSTPAPAPDHDDVSACNHEPCTVVGPVAVAGTTVDLMVDAGGRSGRLRIGGPGSSRVIETTITRLGVKLTTTSLQCLAGTISGCLIRGAYEGGVAGEVVVGRSDTWSPLENHFQSTAGYLALSEVSGDLPGPEIVAVQYDCASDSCTSGPVFGQVFQSNGTEIGCTRHHYAKLENLPGYPNIQLRGVALTRC